MLEAGRHFALVGANGSGKSTIAKLMMGLYRPDGGRILINGTPIAEWPQDALNGLFGVVFQDFARYSLTVRDNVEVAAAGRLDDATVQTSLARTGLGDDFVLRLPQGYDTPLGKVLRGGVDVSGGEWQRLAMARSLAADAPVRILDEPTAALDPLAESDLYRSYSRAATGLTTLLISHRLSSTRIADRILVVDGGVIVESGAHGRSLRLRAPHRQSPHPWQPVLPVRAQDGSAAEGVRISGALPDRSGVLQGDEDPGRGILAAAAVSSGPEPLQRGALA